MIRKNENGITLIALVISIIVLLIMAGVNISLTLGENGIINQAKKSKKETEKKAAKETIDMAMSGMSFDFIEKVWSNNPSAQIGDWATVGMLRETLKRNGYELDMTDITTTGENTDINDELLVEHPVMTIYKDGGEADKYSWGVSAQNTTLNVVEPEFLVDKVEIGDYVDIGINYTGTETGWRVLNKYGSDENGFITVVSAGVTMKYLCNGNSYDNLLSLKNLNETKQPGGDRSYIDESTGEEMVQMNCPGFIDIYISSVLNKDGELVSLTDDEKWQLGYIWSLSPFINFDSIENLYSLPHAFGCGVDFVGEGRSTVNTGNEFEDLYSYITNRTPIFSDLFDDGAMHLYNQPEDLRSSNLGDSNLKTHDMICLKNSNYLLGGTVYNDEYLFYVNNRNLKDTYTPKFGRT